YQMPKAFAVERMCQNIPKDFYFAAKLTRTMTHEIDPDMWKAQAAQYKDGISPLVQSGRLLAVLLQMPPYFNRSQKNRSYLAWLIDELAGLPLAVEFRHRSWAEDRVFAELEKRKVALVSVDEPDLPNLFPKLDVVTNPDLFYIRFHGRNSAAWGSGSMQKQFDYNYSDEELDEWTDNKLTNMTSKAKKGAIFFNNHVRAQAPENALRLISRLIKTGKIEDGKNGTLNNPFEHS
ncbi:MAG: DUF72 domain-containing protein, partial [Desulfobacteraceae bacterium]|nr:DUF72 domain-containing protein [Desulfobacteraceae bacterium]